MRGPKGQGPLLAHAGTHYRYLGKGHPWDGIPRCVRPRTSTPPTRRIPRVEEHNGKVSALRPRYKTENV